jgi:hypothetical protein
VRFKWEEREEDVAYFFKKSRGKGFFKKQTEMITRSAGRAMTSPWQQECDLFEEEEITVSQFLTQRSTPTSSERLFLFKTNK